MTGKQTSCNTKTFQVFFKKAANLNTFSGVMYSRQKLDLGRHRKCSRNGSGTAIYNQNFRFSPASVSGKTDHATRNTDFTPSFIEVSGVSICCRTFVDAVLEKQLLQRRALEFSNISRYLSMCQCVSWLNSWSFSANRHRSWVRV